MSEIKALGKLRNLDRCIDMPMLKNRLCANTNTHNVIAALEAIANEIEAEIAERFMELPVDADGVPIHVGETVYGKYLEGNPEFTVRGFSFDLEHGQWNVQVGDAAWLSANLLSHVKPRTLEDVLNDRINDVLSVMTSGIGIALETALNDSFGEECADEIRELMGMDAKCIS